SPYGFWWVVLVKNSSCWRQLKFHASPSSTPRVLDQKNAVLAAAIHQTATAGSSRVGSEAELHGPSITTSCGNNTLHNRTRANEKFIGLLLMCVDQLSEA